MFNKTSFRNKFKGKFISSVATLSAGTILAQLMLVVASPVLTRLYTPDEFGVFSVYLAILSVMGGIASLRYEQAILLAKDDKATTNLLVLCSLIIMFLCALVLIIIFFVGDNIVKFGNMPTLHKVLWFLPLSIFGFGFFQVFNNLTLRLKNYTVLSKTRVYQSFGVIFFQIILGIIKKGTVGLIIGNLVGQLVGVVTLGYRLFTANIFRFQMISCKELYNVAIRYKRFPIYSTISTLINIIGLNLPIFLLAIFYDPIVVGAFALGQRVISYPISLIGGSITQVYLSEAPTLTRQNPDYLVQSFKIIATKLSITGIVIIGIISTTAPWVFGFIFGDEWESAGLYIFFLGPAYLAQFVASPLAVILTVIEYQSVQLAWDVLRFFLVGGGVYLAAEKGLTDIGAIIIFSLVSFISYIILFILIWISVKKYYNTNITNI